MCKACKPVEACKRVQAFYKHKRDTLINRIKSVRFTLLPAIIYFHSLPKKNFPTLNRAYDKRMPNARHTHTHTPIRISTNTYACIYPIISMLLLLSICLGPFHYFVNMIRFLLRARTRSIYFYYERAAQHRPVHSHTHTHTHTHKSWRQYLCERKKCAKFSQSAKRLNALN